jgi:hypothetical protein
MSYQLFAGGLTPYTAGTGIVVNNTNHTISIDETELFYDATPANNQSVTLSETSAHFQRMRVEVWFDGDYVTTCDVYPDGCDWAFASYAGAETQGSQTQRHTCFGTLRANGTSLSVTNLIDWIWQTNPNQYWAADIKSDSTQHYGIRRVTGINRVA